MKFLTMKSGVVPLLLLLPFLSVPPTMAQSGRITGKVFDGSERIPLPNAIVLLVEGGQRRVTSAEGTFAFDSLTPGVYSLAIRHIAYGTIERRVIVRAGETDSIVAPMEAAVIQSAEVVVQSTRTSSVLLESPYPVEVKRGEELTSHPNVTLPDALHDSPGLALVRDGAWETALSIRGLSRSDVVSLVDNVRMETADDIAGALSLVSLDDLDRAEVIKTSGSTLYGSGAIGGVINLVTKKASFTESPQWNSDLAGGASSVDRGTFEHLAIARSTSDYGLRVSGGYRRAGNTMTPEGTLANSQYDDFNIYSSLAVRTFDRQFALVTYQRSQAQDAGIPGGAPFAISASARYTMARRELVGAEYEIPNVSSSISLVDVRISHQEIDRDVEILQTPTLTLTPHAIHSTSSFQAEARLSPLKDDLLTCGLEAWQRDLDSRRERYNYASGVTIGELPVPASTFFSGGVYFQNEWHQDASPLTVTAGGRYDRLRIHNDDALNPLYTISNGILQTSTSNQQLLWQASTFWNQSWSANAGLTYDFTGTFNASLLAATAYRSPSLEERFQYIDLGSLVRLGNPNLQPERSMALNLGATWHDEAGRVSSDLFLNELTDLVTDLPGTFEGRPATVKANVGEARLYGYEISAERRVLPSTGAAVTLSYVRGEDTRNHVNLPQIAPLQGEVTLTREVRGGGTIELSSSFAAAKGSLASGEIPTAGYALVNLTLSGVPINVGGAPLTLRGGVRNIFNKDYTDFLSTLRGVVRSEPGRNFYVSAIVGLL